MDQARLPYWTGSPDESPSFIFLCVLPHLLMALSLNIIALFLGCPGSRYCLTKYFMEQSTRYLPAISDLLSKIKGSSFGRGKREVYSVVFIFKVSHMPQKHKAPGQGWPLIYLFPCLFTAYSAEEYSCLRFSALFPCGSLSYLFRREKFKASLSAEGKLGCILTLQHPPAMTLREKH